jgi:hypothetical protein
MYSQLVPLSGGDADFFVMLAMAGVRFVDGFFWVPLSLE